MSKEEIEIEKTKDGFKAKVPLITEKDMRIINNEFDTIVDKFSKMIIKEKDLAIAQHIIKKQNKIIDEMATMLEEAKICYFKKVDGGELLGKYSCYNKEDWKQYFEKKVEGSKWK